jgi:predicted double-glycine peptidase
MQPTRELVQETEFTCGPFSVGRMLDHYNPGRTGTIIGAEGSLLLNFTTGEAGTTMNMADVRILLRLNMPAGLRVESMSFADALATNRPFTVAVREGNVYHAVVVEAVENGGKTLRVYDPGIGVVRVNAIEFNKIVASSPVDTQILRTPPTIGVIPAK